MSDSDDDRSDTSSRERRLKKRAHKKYRKHSHLDSSFHCEKGKDKKSRRKLMKCSSSSGNDSSNDGYESDSQEGQRRKKRVWKKSHKDRVLISNSSSSDFPSDHVEGMTKYGHVARHQKRKHRHQLLVEEELEWLSNQDAFPQIEMFDILPMKPNNNVPKNQSHISVLGNSDSIIRIPVQARSKRRRRRRSLFSDFAGRQWWYQYEPKKKSAGVTRMAGMANSSGRRCLHCQSEKTPQWRAGPLGPKTLCNACGVRYKSGRLLPEYRPASSPTFSGDLHSNSHRKVLDMRKQKQKDVMFLPSFI
ncbi:hypothetical protein IFM89_038891 [Coptis chinensis]|uniref:GATA-type domain-containing protein n=1 Tax=Coptis chinensis TaxID=261450 RepID=A0A835J2G2_9MAGN|nr:hypothetical protein IFM89_038891 [Coptis chinensis]